MIRKYHNHKQQTTPWHREEGLLNHHEPLGTDHPLEAIGPPRLKLFKDISSFLK